MSTLDRLFAEAQDLEDYARRYAQYIAQLLASLDCAAIQRVGERLEAARKANATVFILGNGGSASTASHFANDLGIGPRRLGGATYRAVSLSDNVSALTAIANDRHYDEVFVEQLKTLLDPGDLVLAISASGNSPNILRAAQYARTQGAIVVAFTGFGGGQLVELADDVVHIATPHGDYGPVEDLHMLLDHLLTSYLARLTARASAAASLSVSATPNHSKWADGERAVGEVSRARPSTVRASTVPAAPIDGAAGPDDDEAREPTADLPIAP